MCYLWSVLLPTFFLCIDFHLPRPPASFPLPSSFICPCMSSSSIYCQLSSSLSGSLSTSHCILNFRFLFRVFLNSFWDQATLFGFFFFTEFNSIRPPCIWQLYYFFLSGFLMSNLDPHLLKESPNNFMCYPCPPPSPMSFLPSVPPPRELYS